MIDSGISCILRKAARCHFFTENIILDHVIQNLLNFEVNYPEGFLRPSVLSIFNSTLRLLRKPVKKKLQEEAENSLNNVRQVKSCFSQLKYSLIA
jgi:hypothetical protein